MKIPYGDKLLAFLDTETSGLDFTQHELIEVAVIRYDNNRDQVIDEWETKIAPRNIHTASHESLALNGYINNPESYKSNLKSVLIKLNSITQDCILVGQNISFDHGFIKHYMSEFDIDPAYDRRMIDTFAMAWPMVYDKGLPGLGLKDLCTYFNISNVGEHSALIDCRRTLGVYKCLMDLYRNKT